MIFGFWEGFPRIGKVLVFETGLGENQRQKKLVYFIVWEFPRQIKLQVSFWSSMRKTWDKSVTS